MYKLNNLEDKLKDTLLVLALSLSLAVIDLDDRPPPLSLFQSVPKRGLGDKAMPHIYPHAFFIHPPVTRRRIVAQIVWKLVAGRDSLVRAVIGPELVTGNTQLANAAVKRG